MKMEIFVRKPEMRYEQNSGIEIDLLSGDKNGEA